jgi:hypothetical protein
VQIAQNGCREDIDAPQQVVSRDHLVEAKLLKELLLIPVLPPLLPPIELESLFARLLKPFFNSIGHLQTFGETKRISTVRPKANMR